MVLVDSNPAFRQVACRAKQARGASDEDVETVDTEETEDAREDREWSDIIDSGLDESYELALPIDGLLVCVLRRSQFVVSSRHLL